MTIGTESGRDWPVALWRQQAPTAEDQPTDCYTNTFEVIFRDCGGDPSRDYNNLPPRLQRVCHLASGPLSHRREGPAPVPSP